MNLTRPFPPRFRVLETLTTAGMADLYLAERGDGTRVVLKRLPPLAQSASSQTKMFKEEARISVSLQHPALVQVFEWVPDVNGDFMVLEYLEGHDLSHVFWKCQLVNRVLPVGFVLRVGRDLCWALEACHRFVDSDGKPHPIIHRDVALKNVMVTFDGRVKLLDFGLAKESGREGQTQVGMVKGTTGYMSPEQVKGYPLDARSDLFSTGILLHELLTGKRLYEGQSPSEEMRLPLNQKVRAPKDLRETVPQRLSEVVLRALAKDRAERYATARDMAHALDRAAPSAVYDRDKMSKFMTSLYEEEQKEKAKPRHRSFTQWRALRTQEGKTQIFQTLPDTSGAWWTAAVVFAVGLLSILFWVWQARRLPTSSPDVFTDSPQAFQSEPAPSPQVYPQLSSQPPVKTEVAMGKVTLLSFPVAKVMRGSKFLGVTPLFKVSLPVGTHWLSLEGPDGKVRKLSVPVDAKEERLFKVSLEDLPSE